MRSAILRTILFALPQVLRLSAKRSRGFAELMAAHDAVIQIQTKDGSIGRHYCFYAGRIVSRAGIHPTADVRIIFKDVATAVRLLTPPVDRAEAIHAAKTMAVLQIGPDKLVNWFHHMINQMSDIGTQYGTPMPDGTTRFTTVSNGGPTFVYVKDDKIVRTTPVDFDDDDAPSWTINARGKRFTPRRQMVVNPHALSIKSQVYSEKRILYPMKRVDFDPNGERNVQNRGKSGYVRISWDEALDLTAKEISRQKRKYGPGAIALYFGSHHQWGN